MQRDRHPEHPRQVGATAWWRLLALTPLVLSGVASFGAGRVAAIPAPVRWCALPALPRPGTATGSNGAPKMTGPAVGALTGHAIQHGFSLDHGDLVVQPPRKGERPRVSADYAECNALASENMDNVPLSGFVAVSYTHLDVYKRQVRTWAAQASAGSAEIASRNRRASKSASARTSAAGSWAPASMSALRCSGVGYIGDSTPLSAQRKRSSVPGHCGPYD